MADAAATKKLIVQGQPGTAVSVPEDHQHPIELQGPSGQRVVLPANVPVPVRLEIPPDGGAARAVAMASIAVAPKPEDAPSPAIETPVVAAPKVTLNEKLIAIVVALALAAIAASFLAPRFFHGG